VQIKLTAGFSEVVEGSRICSEGFGFFVSSVSSRNLATAAARDRWPPPFSGITETPLSTALNSACLR